MTDPRLGRRPRPFDARDFEMATVLKPTIYKRKHWTIPSARRLDQGQTPHCVGFGWAHWGNTTPVPDAYSDADGDALYYDCKVIDGEPRAEDGSDVRSGAKVMLQRSKLSSYHFSASAAEVGRWLLTRGPVVLGTNWYEAMFTPSAAGHVEIAGGIAGGHCYTAIGFDSVTQEVRLVNSWGTGWGVGGEFILATAQLDRLLGEQGDAVAGVERRTRS